MLEIEERRKFEIEHLSGCSGGEPLRFRAAGEPKLRADGRPRETAADPVRQ
jgi:hypothetical protein